jgi:hypothetical protein
MGIREIRYCDITGSEDGVTTHEIQIDSLRVEIDLADTEYRKLLRVLRPYMDAGRLDASAPSGSLPARATSRTGVSTAPKLTVEQRQELRAWAEDQGIEVPSNNRFKTALVEQWRRETGDGAGAAEGPDDPDDADDLLAEAAAADS